MGILGTPGLMGWSPVGLHVMAFIPVLYLSKVCKNKNQSFVGVYIVFSLLQKLFIKTWVSWLDCFVKRTCDHQDEVPPRLITNEESQTYLGG